ncbi:hypothetical protein [Methylorubrum sp. GM97]|uniref:hypothetical protein n=1 Tax=Methylorubrum sp. GM97 TaxID=2938232 RepID=UPI0021C36A4F|nr:hypothetical protein [Methylorubrum sp. GM97]
MTNIELAQVAVGHLAEAGYEIVRKEPAAGPVMVSRVTHGDSSVTEQRFSVPVETETEKVAKWAARLIGEILEDGWDRQEQAGVEVAAKEALARLRRDRGRTAFEDIDKNPPYGPSRCSETISTRLRDLGDLVEQCECTLRLRSIVLVAGLRAWPDHDQFADFNRRLDLIRDQPGVVGADCDLVNCPSIRIKVEIRFDHYITTVGCTFAPLDLPEKPRKAA